jgi:GNAT superfamily N-acetyltransferase
MNNIKILEYKSEHQPWFERLNRAWIERFFVMEAIDIEVLQDPDRHIISKGGSIIMACLDDTIVGTVALKYSGPGIYEFTKMAVDEKFQGRKVGHALAVAAIQKAWKLGGKRIILYSNTILVPAIALYRKLGFLEVPIDGPYKRSNIKMELNLGQS